MVDGGYLQPPSDGQKPSRIWEETWKRVDRSLPGLFGDIFPEPKATEARTEESPGLPGKPQTEAEPKRDGRKEAEAEAKTEGLRETS